MVEFASRGVIAVLAFATTGLSTQLAGASLTGEGRPIVKGQLQDLYFPTGTSTTRTINYTYEGYQMDWPGPGSGYVAIVAGVISNVAGITVYQGYGCGGSAQHPNTVQVGPGAPMGFEKNWSFDVGVDATVPAGVYTIGLYGSRNELFTCNDPISDPDLTRIGVINVYVQSNEPATAFWVTSNAGNISGNKLYIDHPLTNGNKYALLFVTQNLNPNGGGAVWNGRPVAVTYVNSVAKWAVANEDGAPMPVGVSYNIRLEGGTSAANSSAATRLPIPDGSGSVAEINDPVSNSNPSANIFVTQNRACLVGICAFVPFNKHVGVRYNSTSGRWYIFTQDGTSFPNGGLAFNVKIIGRPGTRTTGTGVHEVFVQQGNTYGDATMINRTSTRHLGAVLIVTPNWNPTGGVGTTNNRATGVYYSSESANWWIRNQDGAVMPGTAAFNVWEPYPNIAQ